jgi:hypothetical protein
VADINKEVADEDLHVMAKRMIPALSAEAGN